MQQGQAEEEARKNWAGSGDAGTEKIWFEVKEKIGGTEFLGYKTTKSDGIVKVLVQDGKDVDSVKSGEFYLVANQTPFYGECGGRGRRYRHYLRQKLQSGSL